MGGAGRRNPYSSYPLFDILLFKDNSEPILFQNVLFFWNLPFFRDDLERVVDFELKNDAEGLSSVKK